MDLDTRRCGEADENYDAISARIHTDGIDEEIGFPVVDGPNVAGLIDAQGCLTHHWNEGGKSALTIQGIAIVQKHLLACSGHGVARRRRYRVADVVTRRRIDSPKFRQPARERQTHKVERTEIRDPHVILTIDRGVSWRVHTAPAERAANELRAVRPKHVDYIAAQSREPCIALEVERQAP